MTEFIDILAGIVGGDHIVSANSPDAEPFIQETRGDYLGTPSHIVLPASSMETAAVMRACAEHRIAVVPQGGNTGLCGGAVATDGEVLLSMKRMNRIRDIDVLDGTMTVESGCILADVQDAARAAHRFFPVSLGAEGSCTIGGNLATNAGGINVLRYGNSRSQVLGIEVVLGDGRIWNGLNPLLKDNTGYDLKQLFIGSEGTLGVITAASLRLYPLPRATISILLGFGNLPDCLDLLAMARDISGDQLSSFELIPDIAMQAAQTHVEGCRNPLAGVHQWYILCQFATSSEVIPLQAMAEAFLEKSFEAGWLEDAVISSSQAQEQSMWRIREGIVAAQRPSGRTVSHDVSVPVSRVPDLISRVRAAIRDIDPAVRLYPFGHIGDGNVHCNMLMPLDMDDAGFANTRGRLQDMVYRITAELGGSFSAEHGIGKLKRDLMVRYKSPLELDMMRAVRRALDPRGLLNPGKVI